MSIETDPLATARQHLLAPGAVDDNVLERTLSSLMSHRVDLADLYFQSTRSESWVLEDGIIKEGNHNIDQGVGVRAISGEKTGFAYSDEIVPLALSQAAHAARSIAADGGDARAQRFATPQVPALYPALDPVLSMTESDRIELLHALDAQARAQDPRVKQVIVSLAGEIDRVLVAASDGTLSADVRPLCATQCERHCRGQQRSPRVSIERWRCSHQLSVFS